MELLTWYLKFNVLLALVFMIWLAFIKGADSIGSRPDSGARLTHLRIIFMAILLFPVLITGINVLGSDAFRNTVSEVLPGQIIVAGQATDDLGRGVGSWWQKSGEFLSLQSLLLMMLALGFIMQSVRLIRQWLALRTIVRQGTLLRRWSRLDIILSEQTCTPFSTKVLARNQIVLPYALVDKPDLFRVAVRHEMQHIRNGDLNWLLLLEALKLLCFWNPVIYLWQKHFDNLQEYACDEALTRKSNLSANHYGNCLLAVATTLKQGEQRLPASSYMIPRLSFFNKKNSLLKRRINMFTNTQKGRFRFLGTLSSGLSLGVALITSLALYTNVSVAQDVRSELLPIVTVPPQYPSSAAQNGTIGWVLVSFDVDKEGNVIDPQVVDRCILITESESCILDSTVFDETTVSSVSRYKYGPAEEYGREELTEGVMQKLTFTLEDGDDQRSSAQRLRDAAELSL
jgi:hypothetical protein